MKQNNIQYLLDNQRGIELILCSNSGISYPLHNHISVIAGGIVLQGEVILTAEGKEKIYRKNEAFVIFPYVPHSIRADSEYTLLSLCINKNRLENFPREIIEETILNLSEMLPLPGGFDMPEILSRLKLADIYRKKNAPGDIFINRLKSSLEAFPEIPLSLDEMAREALISKYRFIGKFKNQTGLTPHRFQLQNRIRKVGRLLHTAETLTEAALTAGFYDQSHFIKEFRKQVGLTPLEYKSSSRIVDPGEQFSKEAE